MNLFWYLFYFLSESYSSSTLVYMYFLGYYSIKVSFPSRHSFPPSARKFIIIFWKEKKVEFSWGKIEHIVEMFVHCKFVKVVTSNRETCQTISILNSSTFFTLFLLFICYSLFYYFYFVLFSYIFFIYFLAHPTMWRNGVLEVA